MTRLKEAEKCGTKIVGIDIDAAAFITMKMIGQEVSTKTVDELKELVDCTDIPFCVKGIMKQEFYKRGKRKNVKNRKETEGWDSWHDRTCRECPSASIYFISNYYSRSDWIIHSAFPYGSSCNQSYIR